MRELFVGLAFVLPLLLLAIAGHASTLLLPVAFVMQFAGHDLARRERKQAIDRRFGAAL